MPGHGFHYDAFHGGGRAAHFVHGHAVVEQSAEQAGQSRKRRRRAHLMPHEARLVQMDAFFQYRLQKCKRVGICGVCQVLLPAAELLFRRAPGDNGKRRRHTKGIGQIVGQKVHYRVALPAKGFRIVCFF
jgi:hypothetical protein